MFASCYTFDLYAMYMISCLILKSERKKESVSVVSLSECEIPARSAVEVSARSALTVG
jgi:hypothetical protein